MAVIVSGYQIAARPVVGLYFTCCPGVATAAAGAAAAHQAMGLHDHAWSKAKCVALNIAKAIVVR
jgi:hypothetical protein